MLSTSLSATLSGVLHDIRNSRSNSGEKGDPKKICIPDASVKESMDRVFSHRQ